MYFKRAYELLNEKNYSQIFINGLGISTKSAVNISLIILDKISNLKIKNIETSTIFISDDIINTLDNEINNENEHFVENKNLHVKYKIYFLIFNYNMQFREYLKQIIIGKQI
jgi:hypothetical protein